MTMTRTELVQRFFELFNPLAWEQAYAMMTDDAVWEVRPRTIGSNEQASDRKKYFKDILNDYEADFKVTPFEIVESADGRFAWCAAKSNAKHKFIGKYGQDYCFQFRFADGAHGPQSKSIMHVMEFADSLYSANFFAKAEKAKEKAKAKL